MNTKKDREEEKFRHMVNYGQTGDKWGGVERVEQFLWDVFLAEQRDPINTPWEQQLPARLNRGGDHLLEVFTRAVVTGNANQIRRIADVVASVHERVKIVDDRLKIRPAKPEIHALLMEKKNSGTVPVSAEVIVKSLKAIGVPLSLTKCRALMRELGMKAKPAGRPPKRIKKTAKIRQI